MVSLELNRLGFLDGCVPMVFRWVTLSNSLKIRLFLSRYGHCVARVDGAPAHLPANVNGMGRLNYPSNGSVSACNDYLR